MIFAEISVEGYGHYPCSLRQVNRAGRPFHRTQNTVEAYRYRFELLERNAHRYQRAEQPLDLFEITYHAVANAAELASNSWTQLRACLLQAYRDYFDLEQIDEDTVEALVGILKAHTKARAKRSEKPILPIRTSAGRTKWIDQSEQDAINLQLSPAHSVEGVLKVINRYGPRLGLRLSEWLTARPFRDDLIVQNAKFSEDNQRGLAPTRALRLTGAFSYHELRDLKFGLDRIRALVRRHGADSVKGMLHVCLHKAVAATGLTRKITFRTYRDQCRANMIADGHDRLTIAGTMGHSAADSQLRYGITRRGRKGQGLAVCSEQLASKVRPGANTISRIKRREKAKADDLAYAALKQKWADDRAQEQAYAYTPFD